MKAMARVAWLVLLPLVLALHFVVCEYIENSGVPKGFLWVWLEIVSQHWYMFTLVMFLMLAVAGWLGRPVGVPSLFRERPLSADKYARTWNSYSVWSSFGVGLL